MTVLATQLLALLLMACALAMVAGALMARSIFIVCMQVAGAGAVVAAVILLLGAGEGALALALFAVGWAPVLLLAGMLLAARTAAQRRGRPWLSIAAAIVAAGAMAWAARDAGLAPPPALGVFAGAVGVWLAPLVFASALACVALLGFGERGVLEDVVTEREP